MNHREPPPIKDLMTTIPVRVEESESIHTAGHLMTRYDIRHLPVTRHGKLVGLISESELRAIFAVMAEVDRLETAVKSTLGGMPIQVGPETSAASVVDEMLKSKADAVVVVEGENIRGIFTVTDALVYLHDIFES